MSLIFKKAPRRLEKGSKWRWITLCVLEVPWPSLINCLCGRQDTPVTMSGHYKCSTPRPTSLEHSPQLQEMLGLKKGTQTGWWRQLPWPQTAKHAGSPGGSLQGNPVDLDRAHLPASAGQTPMPSVSWATDLQLKHREYLPGAGWGKGSRKARLLGPGLLLQAVHPLPLLILCVLWSIFPLLASSRQAVDTPWRTQTQPALYPPKLFILEQHLHCQGQSLIHPAKVQGDD